MDFAKLAAERYSLRKFSDRPVEAEKLSAVLEAGRNAPTAHNLQPQRIFVLQSSEALEKVDGCTGAHFHPPVMLLVAYDPEAAWKREDDGKNHGEIDAAIAVTQMMFQAADLGLGTTYVGMFDPEKLHAAFPELAGLTPIALLPMGYPGRRAPIPPACTRTASPWKSWCGICDNKGSRIRGARRAPLNLNDPTQFKQADATCRLGGVVLCLESPDMTAFAEYSLRTSEGDTKTKAHQIDAENVKIRQLEPECLFSY